MADENIQNHDENLNDGSRVSRDYLILIQTWGDYKEEGNNRYRGKEIIIRKMNPKFIFHSIVGMAIIHRFRRFFVSKMK